VEKCPEDRGKQAVKNKEDLKERLVSALDLLQNLASFIPRFTLFAITIA
jgi:hypothetical protein